MHKPVSYGSVCSGIEAASVAWHSLGWRPAWFAEIEKFPSAVLAHRWPEVSNLGDMTKIAAAIRAGIIEAPDVLVGGTPCQAFSVAGLRNGLADERGQLTLAFVEQVNAIDEKRRELGKPPVIVVWENVPGVFSSKDNAFGCFLAGLTGESCALESPGKRWSNAGYVLGPERATAWRVLDAQFFGVAQRRRRVFVVATARGDIDPAKILFESEGLRRDIAPSRKTRQILTSDAGNRVTNGSHWDGEHNLHPTLNQSFNTGGIVGTFRMRAFGEYASDGTASTVKARDHKDATDLAVTYSDVSRTLLAKSNDSMDETLQTYAIHGTQDPDTLADMAHTLGRNHGQENAVIAFSSKDSGHDASSEISPTLTSPNSGSNQSAAIMQNMAVRRLTPVECERLQGFPDNHTLIPTQKRKQITAEEYAYLRHRSPELTAEQAFRLAADGPRYKAIGNSMAVPVMRWIGRRTAAALSQTTGAAQ
ncbi:DNA cytosine methyltransferase [Lelliottia nimipressuralis]|uniref:DNA (cytosine-5-)-methyltransferase n=1 Tax=Lelliottia nimipressuralis TaxID=69220 RepID=A0ABY3P6N3_9ENTR|nr:DNA cytosine methyltransferase [Lelliottia nimipressuralis]TYT34983.1 DNA cytosine methyltransferase [Lelliottia nimipressuralis]